MKKYISTLLACLFVQLTWAQSGEGYDPQNPGDPQVYYRLIVEASPKKSGSVSPSSMQQISPGATINCYASANTGYKFKQWMVGDKVVSKDKNFTYTMPEENVTLIAYFDWVGNEGYNPENPGDPFSDGYEHKVTLYATPSAGGRFNSSSFYLPEGKTTNVYAYPNSGFRFVSWKQNGKIVSKNNPMEITMGIENLEYTAQFVYDPQNPSSPGSNNFNAATGELVIDDFEADMLSDAINATMGENDYSLIQSMVIAGRMSSYDLGFSYRMSNCSSIDIARTSGYEAIPSYCFEEMSALTKVVLPSCILSIDSYAFSGCNNLSEIDCYAVTPPNVTSTTFSNIPSGVLIRVPSSAIDLYKANSVWNKFTILSLDEETNKITVCLPDDAKDGRYKNMILELDNVTNGQELKMLISDKTSYTFNNLVCSTKYNIYVKNDRKVVLGSILDVELEKENIVKTFESLLQPQTIEVVVKDMDNNDISENISVIWSDADGNYISQEPKLDGYVEGNTIFYSVQLSGDLVLNYISPQKQEYRVKDGDNQIICKLDPLSKVSLSGIVKDKDSGKLLQNAIVTLSQTLNGKYASSVVARTGADGSFTATIYDAPVTMNVSATNYIDKASELETVTNGMNVGDILVSRITGKVINVNLTYNANVGDGVIPLFEEEYDDYSNISYSVFDKTHNRGIEFIAQGTTIVLAEDVPELTTLAITAISKKDAFAPITTECTLNNNGASVTIPIVEWGDLQVSYTQSGNAKNSVLLYDNNGIFIDKSSYSDQQANFKGLKDGNYVLISMCNNNDFNTMHNISEFSNVGLVEGTDYVCKNVNVKSGYITNVVFDNIPSLDLTKFYYTSNDTHFSVNKQSVTVGNYITLRSDIDFKSEYSQSISNVKLMVDLPDNCHFVDNSVLTSEGVGSYSLENNHIIVPLSSLNDKVRFCAIPIEAGDYTPSAYVQFDRGGETILQPIGSAVFKANNLEISVPEKTAFTNVVVKGIAPTDSEVLIYDNDVLVGKTTSMANGKWEAKVELFKPFAKSYHSLYAKVTTTNGNVLLTENKRLEYDRNYTVPAKISMLYNGHTIVFDQIERRNSNNTYIYRTDITDFTFLAEFTKNDAELIRNMEFVVLLSDGSKKILPSEFNESKGRWVAKASFSNSNRLPVNVKVNYDAASVSTGENDYQESFEDQMNIIAGCGQRILDFYDENLNLRLVEDEENKAVYDFDIGDGINYTYSFELMDYDEAIEYLKTQKYEYGYSDGQKIIYSVNESNSKIELTSVLVDDQYAVKICLSKPEGQKARKSKINLKSSLSALKKSFSNGRFVESLGNISGPICDFIGIGDYLDVRSDFAEMCDFTEACIDIDLKWQQVVTNLLLAKCDDGSLKLSSNQISSYYQEKTEISSDASIFHEKCYSYIKEYQDRLRCKFGFDVALAGVGLAISKVGDMAKFVNSKFVKLAKADMSAGVDSKTVAGIMSNVLSGVTDAAGNLANPEFADFGATHDTFMGWAPKQRDKFTDEYVDLSQSIKKSYKKCEKEDEEEPEDESGTPEDEEFPNDNIQPSIDPSGYVYEGIASNRVEGVTATCYYKEQVEDMYGDVHDNIVKWDAEEYDQKNPLFTDKDGRYAWDVPQGLWQVKYEKEGYETAYSEWLPVPPPQLDVNIGIVQNRQPEVKDAHAYEDGVEFTFDKYMIPAYLTTDNIKVSQDGKYVDGKVVLVDEEMAYRDESVTYASTVRFVPNTVFSADKEVTLVVANRVKSYAGIQMAENFTQNLEIEKEVKSILADDLVKVPYRGSKVVTLFVEPADVAIGKIMHAESSSEMLATLVEKDAVIDENGMAQFEINGELPGTTGITFSIDGVKTTATVIANIGDFDVPVVNKPTASIVSGTTVPIGTKVTLSCETEGAIIYYTLDGSCPCDETHRLVYDGTPISITANTVLKAMAKVGTEGWYESEVVTYEYKVDGSILPGDVNEDGAITISDAVGIVNFVIRANTTGLNGIAADANQDGNVSISDAVFVVNQVIRADQSHVKAEQKKEVNASLSVHSMKVTPGECFELPIVLNGDPDCISALQLDLSLPEGLMLEEVGCDKNHNVSHAVQTDGRERIAVLSTDNAVFPGNGESVVVLYLKTAPDFVEGTVSIDGVELVTPNVTAIHPAMVNAMIGTSNATAVDGIGDGAEQGDAYNLQGLRTTKHSRGVVIQNKKKKIRK